jgi:hypothetical protein
VKERPILFSGPMVKALLAGTKTQTRRPVKGTALEWLQPDGFTPEYVASPENHLCPYGFPGDRLWVRETFFAFGRWETRFSEKKGRDEWHFVDMCDAALPHRFEQPEVATKGRRSTVTPAWWKRPAIHMPRAASRILLDVTGVRVERLQDISEADALAEGIVQLHDGGYGLRDGSHYHAGDPRQSYFSLWEAINGAGSVERNDWVLAVGLQRVQA